MNVGFFTGTVKDLDLRHLDSGSQVCNLFLEIAALSDSHPGFVQCISGWDDLATEMANLAVGDHVSIEAYVETEVVDRPDGIKQKNLLVRATRLSPTARVSFIGRAGRDPEVNRFEGRDGEESIVAKINLAVDKRKRDATEPDWYPLEFWGRTAEIVEKYVRKGSQICVIGTIRIDTWKDRTTGDDRSKPVVRVSRLELLNRPQSESDSPDEGGDAPDHAETAQTASAPVAAPVAEAPIEAEAPPAKAKEKKPAKSAA